MKMCFTIKSFFKKIIRLRRCFLLLLKIEKYFDKDTKKIRELFMFINNVFITFFYTLKSSKERILLSYHKEIKYAEYE